jgi:RNA polymerase sigma-70 factor, ECF subfamily
MGAALLSAGRPARGAGTLPLVRAADDEQLLARRLLAGDDGALAEIYDRYSSLVFGLARRVTGSPAAAEDVMQEVFVHLWQHPDRFDANRGGLRAYLGVMAHRRAIDAVRRQQRRVRREERDAASAGDAPTWGVPESAEDGDLVRRVRRAVDRLPEEQRAAVRLAYFSGRTYREVATELSIPEGTAKSRLRLALAKLSDLMEAEGVLAWP